MGGLVFKEDGLSTPRMPPEVYHHVSSHVLRLLEPHFKFVGIPPEAPAKKSHGDIDVLVAEPLNISRPIIRRDLSDILEAHRSKSMGSWSMFHFALPWPEQFDNIASGDEGKDREKELCKANDNPTPHPEPKASYAPSLPDPEKRFCQVDIRICHDEQSFKWHLFIESHGDLWSMLGGIIRHAGLTCAKGLELRIEEVEPHNKVQSRVQMTSDPKLVLDYLGLDTHQYEKPFDTLDEMMAYATTCRFHDPGRWRNRDQWEQERNRGQQDAKGGDGPDKQNLGTGRKHKDRARFNKRPAFRYWINTYLPAHVHDKPGKDAHLTRDEVVEDAKKYFGGDFTKDFDDRREKWAGQVKVDELWRDIRETLPISGTQVGYVVRRMKSDIAGVGDADAASLAEVRKAFQEDRFSDVLVWARDNWKEVRDRQKKLQLGGVGEHSVMRK
ncbi:uncharacterized protein PV06_04391 [Exophiala oligosperma]|uniref:Uncharacterized protein n=1 Tax=Exophiala oligosperma TaxID=215243 RepID=A0A0D2C0N9_9EURO|nr:uncharacterized protein PV06_04391 [Exophiala oligosperma]KIW43272.1 hypothetical protein PV06_04391 [Exophiala oligosperma]